jgi:hypothetical protein
MLAPLESFNYIAFEGKGHRAHHDQGLGLARGPYVEGGPGGGGGGGRIAE